MVKAMAMTMPAAITMGMAIDDGMVSNHDTLSRVVGVTRMIDPKLG